MTEISRVIHDVDPTHADLHLIGADEEEGVQFIKKVEIDSIPRLRDFYSIGATYDGVNSMHSPYMPGNFHPVDHWVDAEWFDREHEGLPQGATTPLYVPLTSSSTVNMYVHEIDVGDEEDKFAKHFRPIGPAVVTREDAGEGSQTFPYLNPFFKGFDRGGEWPGEKGTRLRKTKSVSYSENNDLRLDRIEDLWDVFRRVDKTLAIPSTAIDKDQKKVLLVLFRDQMREKHDLTFSPDTPLFMVLETVEGFIKSRLEEAPVECGEWDSDLEALLRYYEKTLGIPATDDAVSTWIVGILRSLRLPARRVSGAYFEDRANGELAKEESVWAEVMVRPLGWVPVDPLRDTLGRYPQEHALYVAQGAVHVYPERELKIERKRWGAKEHNYF